MIAVSQRDCELIELLVNAGANVEAVDNNGDTALIVAARETLAKNSILSRDFFSTPLLEVLSIFIITYITLYLLNCII